MHTHEVCVCIQDIRGKFRILLALKIVMELLLAHRMMALFIYGGYVFFCVFVIFIVSDYLIFLI
jgi:hypothetical protein